MLKLDIQCMSKNYLPSFMHSSTWRHYLYGAKFNVIVPIISRSSTLRLNLTCPVAKQDGRISLLMFDFDIEYIEGKKNVVADGYLVVTDHQHSRISC